MKKVTGIGGIFFKAKDVKTLNAWYIKNLGFKQADDGQIMFEWRQSDNPDKFGYTVWGVFKESTEYFKPSDNDYMINLRVDNLEALLAELKKEGIQVGELQTFDYGKFSWVMDPEGNKIELWEPLGDQFKRVYEGKTIY